MAAYSERMLQAKRRAEAVALMASERVIILSSDPQSRDPNSPVGKRLVAARERIERADELSVSFDRRMRKALMRERNYLSIIK